MQCLSAFEIRKTWTQPFCSLYKTDQHKAKNMPYMLPGLGPGLLDKLGKHRSVVKIHSTLLQRRPLASHSGHLLRSVRQHVIQKTPSFCPSISQTAVYPNIGVRTLSLPVFRRLKVITVVSWFWLQAWNISSKSFHFSRIYESFHSH